MVMAQQLSAKGDTIQILPIVIFQYFINFNLIINFLYVSKGNICVGYFVCLAISGIEKISSLRDKSFAMDGWMDGWMDGQTRRC